jgi:NAD+ synthase (glutamine-hydrolysing)
LAGADIIFNLSASDELIGKHKYLQNLLSQQSARTMCGYVYAGSGFGESTQDVVYGGNAIIYENGKLMAESERFQLGSQLVISDVDIQSLMHDRRTNTTFWQTANQIETLAVDCDTSKIYEDNNLQYRLINPHPFVPGGKLLDDRCNEIFSIQVGGLAKRIAHTRAKTIVVGISGGLDSTLALLVCVKAMDKLGRKRTDIIGITMPGFGTTDRTHTNATVLMEALGVTQKEISIKDACIQHFKDIEHDMDNHDVTYENAQARERTQILMDVANQLGGFVVGTGDLSELALGWATYNADHMSNYGVNCSIPKTLVRHLVVWVAQQSANTQVRTTLLDIADTPISPELLPAEDDGTIAQRTEDLVGPYELHDFFLYHFLRHGASPKKIYKLALRAFA